MPDNLEHLVDESVFEALRRTSPGLLDAISDLLALGQTPAQIERHLVGKFGRTEFVLYVRGAAEHMKGIKA